MFTVKASIHSLLVINYSAVMIMKLINYLNGHIVLGLICFGKIFKIGYSKYCVLYCFFVEHFSRKFKLDYLMHIQENVSNEYKEH